ncbi:uncharacterized protein LOC129776905 isoform X2 [Toxorhynchites rutilus septentrionalis]|uniref:uncharacterized protein LOC129776905 isoform X2 n=1 Tax=Toxorhynchites rutilus septentrionalis TaxID=329112 RepID=UPI002478831B|nr:uncharacterized protein LOC129776905 isoform X2 [Toxorhynchites rutilus septentrionalis]
MRNWTNMPCSLNEVISLLKFILFLILFHESTGDFHRYNGELFIQNVERGEKFKNDLEQKSRLPRYGNCWMQSLEHLRNGCRILTDSIQVDMALRLTDCFLEMSGQDRLNCVSERTESLKRLCMSEMGDQPFAVYSDYFIQAQDMCFFLESQKWQQEAENTIDTLNSKSKEISEWLNAASKIQHVILEQQKAELTLQEEMLGIGSNLSRVLIDAQQSFDKLNADFRNSSQRHKSMLTDLSLGTNLLHSWIIERFSIVDCLLLYACSLLR